jgi:hypothetical protein
MAASLVVDRGPSTALRWDHQPSAFSGAMITLAVLVRATRQRFGIVHFPMWSAFLHCNWQERCPRPERDHRSTVQFGNRRYPS